MSAERRVEQAKYHAKKTLKHYLRMGLEAKGFRWDSENDAEVNFIVDELAAMVESMIEVHKYER